MGLQELGKESSSLRVVPGYSAVRIEINKPTGDSEAQTSELGRRLEDRGHLLVLPKQALSRSKIGGHLKA